VIVVVTAIAEQDAPFLQRSPYELAQRWKVSLRCKNFDSSTADARLVWESDGVQRLFGTDAIVCPEHKLVYIDNVKLAPQRYALYLINLVAAGHRIQTGLSRILLISTVQICLRITAGPQHAG
jgi:hypothetical protein